jgi:hypothetical protein
MKPASSNRRGLYVAGAPAASGRQEANDRQSCAAQCTALLRRRRVGFMVGSPTASALRHRSRVWPNPSLKAPTHYGRQRKPGPRHSCIIANQAYAAYLRGRL